MRLALPLFLALVGCKEITSTIVGGTVSAGKEVTAGIVEGVEEGRKEGQSVDGAVVVTNAAELAAHGGLSIRAVEPAEGGARVVVAVENTGDAPLRVSGLEVLALDPEGFVIRPSKPVDSVTVPPHAKDQVVAEFGAPPDRVRTVRVWGQDLTPPPAGDQPR